MLALQRRAVHHPRTHARLSRESRARVEHFHEMEACARSFLLGRIEFINSNMQVVCQPELSAKSERRRVRATLKTNSHATGFRMPPLALRILLEEFERNAYPTKAYVKYLASKCQLACKAHLSNRQVQVWFQNQRQARKRRGIVFVHGQSSARHDLLEPAASISNVGIDPFSEALITPDDPLYSYSAAHIAQTPPHPLPRSRAFHTAQALLLLNN